MSEPAPELLTRPLPSPTLQLREAFAHGWCQRCRADNAHLVLLRHASQTRWTKVVLCRFCIADAPGAGHVVIDVIPGLPPDPEPAEPELPDNVVPLRIDGITVF